MLELCFARALSLFWVTLKTLCGSFLFESSQKICLFNGLWAQRKVEAVRKGFAKRKSLVGNRLSAFGVVSPFAVLRSQPSLTWLTRLSLSLDSKSVATANARADQLSL